jgi:hypothetical protein
MMFALGTGLRALAGRMQRALLEESLLSWRKAVDTLILLVFSTLFNLAVVVLNRRKRA